MSVVYHVIYQEKCTHSPCFHSLVQKDCNETEEESYVIAMVQQKLMGMDLSFNLLSKLLRNSDSRIITAFLLVLLSATVFTPLYCEGV